MKLIKYITSILIFGIISCVSAAPTYEKKINSEAEKKTIPVTLQLQWDPQMQFAGYFIANDLGYYQDEGLKVTFIPGGAMISPHEILASGKADFAISWLPKVLMNSKTKDKLQNIAQIFQRSKTIEVSWKNSNIKEPKNWRGKRVGTWELGDELELFAAMRKAGINPYNKNDVTIIKQTEGMSQLLNHKLDAAEAMSYNEYYQLLEAKNPQTGRNFRPDDFLTIDFNNPKLDTDMLQDGIYVRKNWISNPKNRDIAEKFLRASFKGWIFCRDHFDECIRRTQKDIPNFDLNLSKWQLKEVNDAIWPSPLGIGIMDRGLLLQTAKILKNYHFLKHDPNKDIYTTELAEKALKGLEDLDTKSVNYQKK